MGRTGDPTVIYLRCPLGRQITETLWLPCENEAKVSALLHLAKRLMPTVGLTGQLTAELSTPLEVASRMAEMLSLAVDDDSQATSLSNGRQLCLIQGSEEEPRLRVLNVENDSPSIRVPSTVEVPVPNENAMTAAAAFFPLPITLQMNHRGAVQATLLLTQPDDVRLLKIECIGVPEGENLELTMTACVGQSVTQPLPCINRSSHDWQLMARITGAIYGFKGPVRITAKAGTTTEYPLTFCPYQEGEASGSLTLYNTLDGTEHKFKLTGIGLKPATAGTLNINCSLGGCSQCRCESADEVTVSQPPSMRHHPFSVIIHNKTRRTRIYQVESSLPEGLIRCMNKDPMIVCPGHTLSCNFALVPSRCGTHTGVISFNSSVVKARRRTRDGEQSADEDLEHTSRPDGVDQIAYDVNIKFDQGPPIRTLEVSGACLESVALSVPLDLVERLRTVKEDIVLEARVEGHDLHGPNRFVFPNSVKGDARGVESLLTYRAEFRPSIVGTRTGSITFYNSIVGEFWFAVALKALPPKTVKVPLIACELGRWRTKKITLRNPTGQDYALCPELTNRKAFTIDFVREPQSLDNDIQSEQAPMSQRSLASSLSSKHSGCSPAPPTSRQQCPQLILLPARSKLRVGIKFIPIELGEEDHTGEAVFKCQELECWSFRLTGRGDLPSLRATLSTTAQIGRAKTFLMPFFNPLTYPVHLRVLLKPFEPAPSVTLSWRAGARASQKDFKPDCLPRFEAFRLLINREKYALTSV
ncbi:hypothetical protein AAHC03_012988 [Spirometra sp. Aus1]